VEEHRLLHGFAKSAQLLRLLGDAVVNLGQPADDFVDGPAGEQLAKHSNLGFAEIVAERIGRS